MKSISWIVLKIAILSNFLLLNQAWSSLYPQCPEIKLASQKFNHKTDALENFELPLDTANLSDSVISSFGFKIIEGEVNFNLKFKTTQNIDVQWKGQKNISENTPKIASVWLGDLFKAKSPDQLDSKWKEFWNQLTTGEELALLEKCSFKDCKIKFNQDELSFLINGKVTSNSSLENKPTRALRFFEILKNRMLSFLDKNKKVFYNYEKTWFDFNQADHLPQTLFSQAVKIDKNHPPFFKGFGFEKFNPEPGKHKPVTALFYRECFLNEKPNATSCIDTVLYNNHYFDIWVRYFTLIPLCFSEKDKSKHTLLGVSEVLDIDQLKQGSFTRLLLAPAMRGLVEKIVEGRIKNL